MLIHFVNLYLISPVFLLKLGSSNDVFVDDPDDLQHVKSILDESESDATMEV